MALAGAARGKSRPRFADAAAILHFYWRAAV
jgi:hypothetical protein